MATDSKIVNFVEKNMTDRSIYYLQKVFFVLNYRNKSYITIYSSSEEYFLQ